MSLKRHFPVFFVSNKALEIPFLFSVVERESETFGHVCHVKCDLFLFMVLLLLIKIEASCGFKFCSLNQTVGVWFEVQILMQLFTLRAHLNWTNQGNAQWGFRLSHQASGCCSSWCFVHVFWAAQFPLSVQPSKPLFSPFFPPHLYLVWWWLSRQTVLSVTAALTLVSSLTLPERVQLCPGQTASARQVLLQYQIQMMKTVITDMRRHIKTRTKIDGDKRTRRLSRSEGTLSRKAMMTFSP